MGHSRAWLWVCLTVWVLLGEAAASTHPPSKSETDSMHETATSRHLRMEEGEPQEPRSTRSSTRGVKGKYSHSEHHSRLCRCLSLNLWSSEHRKLPFQWEQGLKNWHGDQPGVVPVVQGAAVSPFDTRGIVQGAAAPSFSPGISPRLGRNDRVEPPRVPPRIVGPGGRMRERGLCGSTKFEQPQSFPVEAMLPTSIAMGQYASCLTAHAHRGYAERPPLCRCQS